MSRVMFWAATTTFFYSYVLFPIIVLARSFLSPRPHRKAEITPSLTVVIAAHNEAVTIGRKLESVLAQDYPPERVSVVVASDGSNDGTPEVVAAFAEPNVEVLNLPRVGKAEALAAAVTASDSEILVFSDANSILAPAALRNLVAAFVDPSVGGVAGNQVYALGDDPDAIAVGERSYWDFDRAMKEAQSKAGNVIGATGALYAIRRSLFSPILPGVNDDFYLSLKVIEAGHRLVFEPAAVVYEAVAPSRELEYHRRVRIMTRGLRCVAMVPGALDPRKTGFYAIQLLSQKVLMRLMAVPLVVISLTSLVLYPRAPTYRLATWAQLAFYGLAAAGLLLGRRPIGHKPYLALPAYFCVIQTASLHATWNLLRGTNYDRWQPARPAERPLGEQIEDEDT